MHAQFDALEARRLFAYDIVPPRADIRADTDRDNLVTYLDNQGEIGWTPGKTGRGATVLPNLDRDNTATPAPDNWTGGNWNGKYVGPNNVIDNDADLADIARVRLLKLQNVDSSFFYEVTLKLLPAENDPDWLTDVPAQDRVRVFMPSREISGGRVLLQAGDSAVFGPGLGDTIRFVNEPKAANEYSTALIRDDGYLELGIEGLRMGAGVRLELTVRYKPVTTFFVVEDEPENPFEPQWETLTDTVELRVAPFTLVDHRQRVASGKGSVFVDVFAENTQFRKVLREVFGDRLIEGDTGDIWQQDGSEIGYVSSPYGSMPVVLELPRSRGEPFTGGTGIRAFLRGRLLAAGVGVSAEVAAYENDNSSSYGGDIESLPNLRDPTAPPYLLRSAAMPTYLKQFFDAQNANPVLEISPDRWLAVGHVDELVHLASNGKDVVMADADLGYALLLWAYELNPRARMQAGMYSAAGLPTFTEADGVTVAELLRNGRLRRINIEKAMNNLNLPATHRTIQRTLGLTAEVSTPRNDADNQGSIALSKAGVFTQLLPDRSLVRSFQVTFIDDVTYELRYRDGKNAWSGPVTGRRDRDEVFGDARAYLLKHFWSGTTASAGDRITFSTNPDATFLRAPSLFLNSNTYVDFGGEPEPEGFEEEAMRFPLIALTSSFVNVLADGPTVITPMSFAPRVNFDGTAKQDLFDAYARNLFDSAGYTDIRFVDARFYHNSSGGVHCGTNVFRDFAGAGLS